MALRHSAESLVWRTYSPPPPLPLLLPAQRQAVMQLSQADPSGSLPQTIASTIADRSQWEAFRQVLTMCPNTYCILRFQVFSSGCSARTSVVGEMPLSWSIFRNWTFGSLSKQSSVA